MRRRVALFPVYCLLFLSACAEQSALPPSEVMERAAIASATLTSSEYEGNGRVEGMSPFGEIQADIGVKGVTQDVGKTTKVSVEVKGTLNTVEQQAFTANFTVIRDETNTSYVLVEALQLDPPSSLFPFASLQALAGQWWVLPTSTGATTPSPAAAAISVAPDPEIIAARAKIVTVTRDRGIQRTKGRRAHRYDVTVDREKLVGYLTALNEDKPDWNEAGVRAELDGAEAVGELWIDAETYYVLAMSWSVTVKDALGNETLSAEADIRFSNHDRASPIELPRNANTLAPDLLFPRQNSSAPTETPELFPFDSLVP